MSYRTPLRLRLRLKLYFPLWILSNEFDLVISRIDTAFCMDLAPPGDLLDSSYSQ